MERHELMDRMSIESLSVSSDGNFTVYYNDSDLFGGHAITVSGHINKGLKAKSHRL
jgi:hypothetical protein